MLFNSISFIFVFLPATVFIFFVLGAVSRAFALFFLTAASLLFYAQTNSKYLYVLVPSIIVNYLIGSALSRAWVKDDRRLAVVAWGIAANLACLFIFKYLDLFIHTIDSLHVIRIDPLKIELPLGGISFFTFTSCCPKRAPRIF